MLFLYNCWYGAEKRLTVPVQLAVLRLLLAGATCLQARSSGEVRQRAMQLQWHYGKPVEEEEEEQEEEDEEEEEEEVEEQ